MIGAGVRRLLGTAGGLGRLPAAPGTWTSLATVLAVAALFGIEGGAEGGAEGGITGLLAPGADTSPHLVRGLALAVAALLFGLGWPAGNHAETDLGSHDPGSFVLDEVVGQLLALLPLLPGPPSPLGLALAFALFRVFDILKPPPCRRLEALPGGLGIMADDVGAGLYALLIVALVGP